MHDKLMTQFNTVLCGCMCVLGACVCVCGGGGLHERNLNGLLIRDGCAR